jgi:hypothetical protein
MVGHSWLLTHQSDQVKIILLPVKSKILQILFSMMAKQKAPDARLAKAEE